MRIIISIHGVNYTLSTSECCRGNQLGACILYPPSYHIARCHHPCGLSKEALHGSQIAPIMYSCLAWAQSLNTDSVLMILKSRQDFEDVANAPN